MDIHKSSDVSPSSWSLTIGNGAENHVGMEFLGKKRNKGEGWNLNDLNEAKKFFELIGKKTEMYNLNTLLPPGLAKSVPPAYFMVVRQYLSDECHKKLIEELCSYDWDNKYFDTRRGKVLNKLARHNVCYGDVYQSPDYENKKGTIINWGKSPIVHTIKKSIEKIMNEKDLLVEGNKYDNIKKNGIGAHGDTERVIVACCRVGASNPIKFGYFHKGLHIGESLECMINGGDLYFMSEEAVGTNWRSYNRYTIRHAAGSPKYLKFNTG